MGWMSIAADVCGWSSTVTWSASYYPQTVMNCYRRCVVGLSFDFLSYNIIGFFCYTLYNCLLFWDPAVRRQYHEEEGGGDVPVFVNDVAFAIHGLILTSFNIIQCLIFDRGNQKLSRICKILSSVGWAYVFLVVLFCFVVKLYNYYRCLMLLALMKVLASFVKYVPQAYLNFKRKSTVGWSVGNVILDFTGGVLSLMQMVFLALDEDDSTQLSGNPAKLGLAVETLFFDVLFMIQHFCMYTDRRDMDAERVKAAHLEEEGKSLSTLDDEIVEQVHLLPNSDTDGTL